MLLFCPLIDGDRRSACCDGGGLYSSSGITLLGDVSDGARLPDKIN